MSILKRSSPRFERYTGCLLSSRRTDLEEANGTIPIVATQPPPAGGAGEEA